MSLSPDSQIVCAYGYFRSVTVQLVPVPVSGARVSLRLGNKLGVGILLSYASPGRLAGKPVFISQGHRRDG